MSDQAQLHTIAFDGLAFLTGDFGSDTFLPPGKVSDYFGFQYMRDIDAKEGGHNTSFLTRIAHNMLAVLNKDQKAQLLALGKEQENDIRRFAERARSCTLHRSTCRRSRTRTSCSACGERINSYARLVLSAAK